MAGCCAVRSAVCLSVIRRQRWPGWSGSCGPAGAAGSWSGAFYAASRLPSATLRASWTARTPALVPARHWPGPRARCPGRAGTGLAPPPGALGLSRHHTGTCGLPQPWAGAPPTSPSTVTIDTSGRHRRMNHNNTKLPRLLPRLPGPLARRQPRVHGPLRRERLPELTALRRVQLVRTTNLAAHRVNVRRC